MRRGVTGVVGATIERIEFPRCRYRPISVFPNRATFRRRVAKKTIQSVDRLGKRVLLVLSDNLTIVLEPRMTGLVLVSNPPNQHHLRLGLRLRNCQHERLWFWDRRGLGSVAAYWQNEYQERFGPGTIGPDALAISVEELRDRLRSSQREIKVALLDQKVLAGIGNLYASELLHTAGVHPRKKCNRITWTEWKSIHRAMNEILQEAIRYEGSTLSDGTYRNALNKSGSYQNQHRVYDKFGRPCPNCDAPIRRIVQAQRSTFFCQACQRR